VTAAALLSEKELHLRNSFDSPLPVLGREVFKYRCVAGLEVTEHAQFRADEFEANDKPACGREKDGGQRRHGINYVSWRTANVSSR